MYDHGVSPKMLAPIIEVVTTPSHLDQASLASITGSLFPSGKVPKDVVISILSTLGHGKLKAPLNIQAALLRWLILVYHMLEHLPVLSQAYSLIFNLLSTATLRYETCMYSRLLGSQDLT